MKRHDRDNPFITRNKGMGMAYNHKYIRTVFRDCTTNSEPVRSHVVYIGTALFRDKDLREVQ